MNIAVFCGSHLAKNPHFAEAAHAMGALIAEHRHRLIYGGSSWGYMGIVAQAALQAGGEVVAIIPSLFSQEVIDSQPVTELVVVESMSERKHELSLRSDAFIALSGGAGTLDEVTEMMTNNQLSLPGGMSSCRNSFGKAQYAAKASALKPIGILNTDSFFSPFMHQLEMMCNEGLLAENHYRAVLASPTPQELLHRIETWREK